jgi:hypothetical protein
MAKLSAKQEAFVKMMTTSEELALRGFNLLLKRPDLDKFFDALKNEGLFDPSRNPAPAPAAKEGYFYIPYWSPLDYLTAIAKRSGENDDSLLAKQVLDVVRSVSAWRTPEGSPQSNYHTFRKFAEMLGLVPTSSITSEDIAFIGTWLKDRFEPGLVTRALDGALTRLLASSSPEDWEKAVQVLQQCVISRRSSGESESSTKPARDMEDYWLTELLNRHAATFGARNGRAAANILTARVREIFSSEGHKLSSVTYRPAIENNSQNFRWRADENWSVEGLRDVLVSWCENDLDNAKAFVKQLLTDELEILRRLGIFLIAQRWTDLRDLYIALLGPELFAPGHFHELYNLLQEHFADLKDNEKAATVKAVRQISAPSWSENPSRSLKRIQLRWLTAIADKGDKEADQWLAELEADGVRGRSSSHPDFDSYIESRVGPGLSQYSVQELVDFAKSGIVVEKLDAFQEKNEWGSPTLEGLVSTLTDAVRSAPEPFLKLLPNFLHVKAAFQHCVIWGLQQAWQGNEREPSDVDWSSAWESLITFFEQLLGNPNFWEGKVPETAAFVGNRDWVASAISGFLQAGTRNDDHAYSSNLLPRTWPLIQILLENTKPIDTPPDDAMSEAINSSKGRAIEVLFSHSLRACRAADKASGSHAEAWEAGRSLFEGEIEKCTNANYEFSTLAGAYLPQLEYMDLDWTKANVDRIFPAEFPSNSICAIDGLAYASFTRPAYAMLARGGVLDRALRYELKGRNARERLLERIAAGYLWGEEDLESSRFAYIYGTQHIEDLAVIARVLWSVRDSISDEQKERVIEYWDRCVVWSQTLAKPPAQLFSALSTLSCYLMTADGRDRELLEAVAPYIHDGYNADSFFHELLRLVDVSPDGVSSVLGKAIELQIPSFDFENRLKSLLLRLAEKGKDVILFVERLRTLGMQDVFDRLTHPS